MAKIEDMQFTVPYVADDSPVPLPSQDEIENASEILADITGRRVVRVGEHYVVKYGINAEEVEAATMIYLRKTTSMNIPKVYAVYRSGDQLFIVMEFIPGDTLQQVWSTMSTVQKEQVCRDLKLQVDHLRSLPSLGYFGAVGRRPMPDGIFWIYERETPHINGPFDSEEDLNTALVEKTLLADEFWAKCGPQRANFYRRLLPQALRNHAPVFTHADFQRKNIIVRSRPDPNGEKGNPPASGFHVTLVDWENSGWYPSYWEFCGASWAFRFDDDWPEYVEQIMDTWPIEYAWLRILRDYLWT